MESEKIETEKIPKRFKITQAILGALMYIVLCAVAVGARIPIDITVFIYMVVCSITSLFHHLMGDDFVAISNMCFAILTFIVFVILI